MKSRPPALLLICAILFAGSYACYGTSLLRFDGLYCLRDEESDSDATYYLRFYPDGDVLVVASIGTPKDLARWFSRDHSPRPPSFHYSLSGSSIRFKESTESSDLWYRGTVHQGYLTLDVRGRLRWSGRRIHRGQRRYDFVPLEMAP